MRTCKGADYSLGHVTSRDSSKRLHSEDVRVPSECDVAGTASSCRRACVFVRASLYQQTSAVASW